MRYTHKVTTATLIVTAVIFAACVNPGSGLNSNSSPSPSPSPTSSATNIQTGGWGICCTLSGTGASMDCAAPKTNCFDEVVIESGPSMSAYRLLDESVDKGTTATFFTGEEWKKVFPDLDKFPKQLDMLRNGLPLLRFESSTKGLVRYVATRQSREEILSQTRGKGPTPISGVEFALSVRQKR